MIKLSKLFDATDSGRRIIEHYYPDSVASFQQPNRKFKARLGEKTASAMVVLCPYKETQVWKVIDYGDDGRKLDPIDIAMKEDGIINFNEAVLRVAQMFDVHDELDRSVNKPDFKEREANQDEKEGEFIYHLLQEIPAEHLKVLGPNVTKEVAESLHWYEAEYVGYVRNRRVILRYSNENYPIFMRECLVSEASGDKKEVKFFKVYEPLNPEKQYRFNYTPKGVKPVDYINGLAELKKQYRDFNAAEEAALKKVDENAAYKEKKLDEVFICSGERDSLCCKSVGYTPIWFNSETYHLTDKQYHEIMKYTNVLYNIPDIDTTGIKKGKEFALRFKDVHTVWLPNSLAQFRDNRGKHRKDLRDWMEIHRSISDFRDLLALAMPAKFWVVSYNKKTGAQEAKIDTSCLLYFLSLNGFYTLRDDNSATSNFVRVEGNIVTKVKPRDIRKFIVEWSTNNYLDRTIRNLILNSNRLSDAVLENLPEVDLNFKSYTPNTQLFFCERSTIEVSGEDIIEHRNSDGPIDRYVWRENVLEHPYKKLDNMFTITRSKNVDGEDVFDIQINGDVKSCVFGYVINSSRVYWREELEYAFNDKSEDEAIAYKKAHKFDIAGPNLDSDQIREQKQNLINKIFAIGYMLHRYKSPSRAWAPQAMDNKIGDDGQCNGRSGKSFLFKSLAMFMKTVKLDGRNSKLMDNPHVFDQVNIHTDFILVDDCAKYLPMDVFYAKITSDLTVNPKNNSSFNIAFEDSPKFGFTTNYVPLDFDSSTEARLLYMVYSDYYHQKAESNDYLETRSIRDDFGRDLFARGYSDDDWNFDVNFLLQCCRFYLSLANESVKILPPMGNIIFRKHKSDMGENFEDWANVYFAKDSDNLDKLVVRKDAFEDYLQVTKAGRLATMKSFTKKLKAFCEITDYIHDLNPPHLCNSQGRITRRDGDSKQLQDYIYLRSEEQFNSGVSIDTNNNHNESDKFIADDAPF